MIQLFKQGIFKHPLSRGSWKDVFIPHSGNNHKPTVFHPHRALFHISLALVIKAIVFLVVLQYPLTAWMTPDVLASEGRKIITLTNNLRASVSAGNLAENSKLNQAAYQKVQDMFINQYFAHRSPEGRGLDYFARQGGYTNYYVVGENLAVGYDNAESVMVAWQNSPTHYKNLVDTVYRDIGVSIVGGQYKDKETVFIAQYFGSLQAPVATPTTPPAPTPTPSLVTSQPTSSTVQGSTTTSAETKPKATVQISQPAGKPAEKVIKVTATLPASTTQASAQVLDKSIELEPEVNGEWQGQEVITLENDPETVVPPVLNISDANGAQTSFDVEAENIIPDQSSLLSQYQLYKNHPNKWLNAIFSLSTWYYEVMLVLAMAALVLNIAVAHHVQHPPLIASGVIVVMSMFFLLVI